MRWIDAICMYLKQSKQYLNRKSIPKILTANRAGETEIICVVRIFASSDMPHKSTPCLFTSISKSDRCPDDKIYSYYLRYVAVDN